MRLLSDLQPQDQRWMFGLFVYPIDFINDRPLTQSMIAPAMASCAKDSLETRQSYAWGTDQHVPSMWHLAWYLWILCMTGRLCNVMWD